MENSMHFYKISILIICLLKITTKTIAIILEIIIIVILNYSLEFRVFWECKIFVKPGRIQRSSTRSWGI